MSSKKKNKKLPVSVQEVVTVESPEDKMMKMEAKLAELEKNQKNSDVGTQKYGYSKWSEWVSGREKGYHRTVYIDIAAMLMPRNMM